MLPEVPASSVKSVCKMSLSFHKESGDVMSLVKGTS